MVCDSKFANIRKEFSKYDIATKEEIANIITKLHHHELKDMEPIRAYDNQASPMQKEPKFFKWKDYFKSQGY